MKRTFPYLLLVLALPMWMCKKENSCNCFKGTGDIIQETRQLAQFRNVYVEDNVNVIFQEDTVQRITVEAGKHLVNRIITEMDGDLLRIRNENKCNFMRRYDIPVNVYIHYVRNQFYQVRTKGTGLISNSNPCTSDSIDLNSESSGDMSFEMGGYGKAFTHQHGAGDITLTGSCDQIFIFCKGTGFTITDACHDNYTFVYTNTTGKITVAPLDHLISIIDGSGNVYYGGQPNHIESTENSSGKLLRL